MLKRIATAVVLIPIVLVLILRAPVSVLAVVAGVVALLTIHEFLKLTESYGVQAPAVADVHFLRNFLFASGVQFREREAAALDCGVRVLPRICRRRLRRLFF